MSNREKGLDRWNRIIQVSVTEEVKNEITAIANESGMSQSNVVRELINQGLGREPFADD